MPDVCCDTSFLFATYANDVHTPAALAAISQLAQPLVLSGFNQFELANAFRLAKQISALYTHRNGYRAFDILHVAAALHFNASEFLSFDVRQRALAESEGLMAGP